jgi:hypothetical protein
VLTIDRWRKWHPSAEKLKDPPICETPKPPELASEGFEGSSLGKRKDFSFDHSENDPEAWREDFTKWISERCVHREGQDDSTSVGCLWVDFCAWAQKGNSDPCKRQTFTRLMGDAGFRCADGMAAGLVFKADMEAVLQFQKVRPSTTRTARTAARTGRTDRENR